MNRISIELVPRNQESLFAAFELVKENFPFINTVNIPDLRRFELRSWDACRMAAPYFAHSIPHLRASDFCLDQPKPLFAMVRQNRFSELLVVQGDPHENEERGPRRPATTLELIQLLAAEMPELKIYAALDPYRSGVQAEVDYLHAKRAAGAAGFFTQPFFDLRLAEIYLEQLAGIDVYWGVSPVLSAKSESYWRKRNRAFFPTGFEPTLGWNQKFGREMLRFVHQVGGNIYFMPIRVDLFDYLCGIFDDMILLPAAARASDQLPELSNV